MSRPPSPAKAPPRLQITPDLLARFELLLQQTGEEYRAMIGEIDHHRQALTRADRHALAECVHRQESHARRLAELDAQRVSLLRALMPNSGPGHAPLPNITTSQLAALAPEPHRSRLTQLAASLRSLLEQLADKQRVVRVATESLLSHAQGVIHQISRQLSHTGTYARGHAAPAGQVVSALDVVS
jgi:hypothetical protein